MRSRNIKPGFFKNEILGVQDPLIQIAFIGLWCMADRDGILEDRPLRLKAEIFPYRENIDFNGYLTVMSRLDFIQRYVVEGKGYILIKNFSKHQNPHHTEKSSGFPKPLTNSIGCDFTVISPLNNGDTPADSLIPDSLIHDSLIPEKDLLSDSPESDHKEKPVYPESFEKFWIAYPKKEGKGAAYKSYQKIKAPRPSLNKILDSIETHSKTEKWKNKQYIPLPATFLNQRRWEDEFTHDDFNVTKTGNQISEWE